MTLRAIFVSCVIAAALCVVAPAKAVGENTWVVAIGNNEGDPDETTLLYAERDATQLSDVLRRHGGVTGDRITLLLGQDAATVQAVLSRMNERMQSRTPAGNKAVLVVFYSGHADARALHLGGTQLTIDALKQTVESSDAGLRLLIVDACRSGTATRVKGAQSAAAFPVRIEGSGQPEGLAIITSATSGEQSQESDRLQASFFSHHLVNGLRGAADRNGDGKVTLSEAYGYAYARTVVSSGRTLKVQHPTFSFAMKGRRDFALSEPGASRAGVVRLSSAGSYLVLDRRGGESVVAELTTSRDAAVVALPPGAYRIQQRDADEYREYDVVLTRGAVVSLSNTPYESKRYDRLVRERGGRGGPSHGVTLMGAGRSALVSGEGATPHLVLGYGLDLAWLSAGVRLRGSTTSASGVEGGAQRDHSELGAGLAAQHYVDLRHFSVSFGVWLEGAWHQQRLETAAAPETRNSGSFAVGALLSLEKHLAEGWALRLEGGPLTTVYEAAEVQAGAEVGSASLATRLTAWGGGGVVWRY